MNIINTLIIIIIGLIIVNLSCCYNIEGMSTTSCNVAALGLGDPRLKRTADYTGYYKGPDGWMAGIRGHPGGEKIDSTKTQLLDALECLYDIGVTDIMDVVEDPNLTEREIKINTKKEGDYKFIDNQETGYSLNVWTTAYSHNIDYFDDFKYSLIKNISLGPTIKWPSWMSW